MNRFLEGLFARLQSTFNAEQIGQQVGQLVEAALVAIAVFVTYYLLWRGLSLVMRGVLRRAKADQTTTAFAGTIVKYGILLIGAVHGLGAAGINTAGVLTSLGIVGLTFGFAARDALSNIISGLLIFWDRPFVIGDLIEIGGKYGRVDTITLRSTRVVTVDGKMLAVPNTEIINSTVASYTNFPNLRLDVAVTIGTTEDIDRVRAVLLPLVSADAAYLKEPPPRMVVKAINDYNIEVELRAWIRDERQHILLRFALREKMLDALRAAEVELPFETLQLAPIEIRESKGGA